MSQIKSIGVLTSGGDAPGMNAAIRAVVRASIYYNKKAYGIYRGYDGLIENDLVELNARSVKNILSQGGTFLKSARSAEFRTKEGRQKAIANLRSREIDALVVIGGDGSFTGANLLYEEHGFPVVGIPGTIDNDLFGTDFTIGFDTATNTVVECVDKIRDTAASHRRLFFVEVMGRDAGFIALRTAVATGAQNAILPEENMRTEDLLEEIEKSYEAGKTSNMVIVAEGNRLGTPYELSQKVKEKFPQIDTKVTILGHLQRGGAPSCFDRVLASQLGIGAVEALLNGKSGIMVGMTNNQLNHVFLPQAIKNQAVIDMDLRRISKILSI
ncbi:MAG: 6-phosphofructokinase [Schleiferiaceae bacterium]